MGAVDVGDQLQATDSLQHRVCRGRWQATAWTFLLDTMLVNSYLLQLHEWPCDGPEPRASLSQRDWRHRLIKEISDEYSETGSSRQRYRSGDTSVPVDAHKAVHRGKNSPCLACQGLRYDEARLQTPDSSGRGQRQRQRQRQQQRQQPLGEVSGNSLKRLPRKLSRWGCDVCDVSICHTDKCWYFYHRLD